MTTKASTSKPAKAAAKPAKSAAAKPTAKPAKTTKSATAKPAKTTVAKAAAVKKPATKAKAAAPKAPAAAKRPPPTRDQRLRYVEVAAYYIAERRAFAPGNPAEDWLNAEAEIDRLLAEGKINL